MKRSFWRSCAVVAGLVAAILSGAARAQLTSPSFIPCDRGLNSVYEDACGGNPDVNHPQSDVEHDSVTGRRRPDHEARGFDLGGMTTPAKSNDGALPLSHIIAFPSAAVQIENDDNVLRAKNAPKSSMVTRLKAGLDIASNYGRHGFLLESNVEDFNYAQVASENFTTAKLRAALWADIGEHAQFIVTPFYGLDKEIRGGINDSNFARPPGADQQMGLRTQFIYHADPIFIKPEAEWANYQFRERGPGSRGLTSEFDQATFKIRAAYMTTPVTYYFIEPRVSRVDYSRNLDSLFGRSGSGWEVLAGTFNDITPVLHYELAAGWLWRGYEDPRLDAASGPSFLAKLVWNPLNALTLQVNASRKLYETTTASYAGLLYSSLFFGADLEVAEPLIFSSSIEVGRGSYVGGLPGTESRADTYITATLGASYLISHWARLGAGWERKSRDGTGHAIDYVDNRLFASARLSW